MSSSSSSQTHCRTCGGKLDASLPGGGCPACLWGGLISDEPAEQMEDDLPEVDGYKIQREIGRGGMGVVYLAKQENPAREVALKIVAPYSLRAASQRMRFLVEIEAMAAVTHPALLPLYESGEDEEGRPWFTMRLATGGTLAERLGKYQGQWRMAAELMVRLGEAVQYSHERGILHRDLKPANVLFDEQNNAYVADFGLAKWAESEGELTQTTEMLGSPAYLAPEAVAGGAKATTTASDVYGLGSMFYELLTGSKLYEGESAAVVMSQILNNSPVAPRQRVAKIPRDLEIITLKAIAREPGKRYVSAAAMVEDIKLWLEGKAITARPASQWEHLWNWVKRNPAAASLATLLAASVATGGMLLWRANQRLQLSLDDARARVEFMTHELPAALEPIGRLDLLDSVFQNVSEHYQLNQSTDATSLAREADFLTQWAQILRPRGMDKAAIKRLEQAMEKARAATTGNDPSVAAVISRVRTGRRLGEVLIEGRRLDEADYVIKEAAAFLAKHPQGKDIAQILDAEVTTELAFLASARNDHDVILSQAEEALRKWQSLLPELERQPVSPSHQSALLDLLTLRGLLVIHETDQERATARRTTWKEMAEHYVNLVPDNAIFRSLLLSANLRMARQDGLSAQQVQTLLEAAEAQVSALISLDETNTRWLTDAVASADALAAHAVKQNRTDEVRRWRAIMSQRLDAVFNKPTTDMRFLTARAEFSIHCAKLHVDDDWPKARHHYEALLVAKKRMSQLDPSQTDLDSYVDAVFGKIKAHEGESVANAWLAEFKKSP